MAINGHSVGLNGDKHLPMSAASVKWIKSGNHNQGWYIGFSKPNSKNLAFSDFVWPSKFHLAYANYLGLFLTFFTSITD